MREPTCSLPDCGGKTVGRGYCNKHYKRWRKHGDPTIRLPWVPPKIPRGVCTADDCGKAHAARGLCATHYSTWYRGENPDAYQRYQAAYRLAHAVRRRQCARDWRATNRERARAAVRSYAHRNRDRLKERRRDYRDRNRDVIRASNQRHRARRKNAPINDFTAREWREIKAAYRQRCAYCGRRRDLTVDHVIPLSRGGDHTARNVAPACGSCNSRKGDRAAPQFQPLLF